MLWDHLKIQISFIVPVTLGKVKCTTRDCYGLDEDSAHLHLTRSSFELNELLPLFWLCVYPQAGFLKKKKNKKNQKKSCHEARPTGAEQELGEIVLGRGSCVVSWEGAKA